jgi:hypothetical protein
LRCADIPAFALDLFRVLRSARNPRGYAIRNRRYAPLRHALGRVFSFERAEAAISLKAPAATVVRRRSQ